MTGRKTNDEALVKRAAVMYAAEESIRKLDKVYSEYNDFQTLLLYLQALGALKVDHEDEAMLLLFALLCDCDEAGHVSVIKTLIGEDSKQKKVFMDAVDVARKELIMDGIKCGYDVIERLEISEETEEDDVDDITDNPCNHCIYFFTRDCSGIEEGDDNDE